MTHDEDVYQKYAEALLQNWEEERARYENEHGRPDPRGYIGAVNWGELCAFLGFPDRSIVADIHELIVLELPEHIPLFFSRLRTLDRRQNAHHAYGVPAKHLIESAVSDILYALAHQDKEFLVRSLKLYRERNSALLRRIREEHGIDDSGPVSYDPKNPLGYNTHPVP